MTTKLLENLGRTPILRKIRDVPQYSETNLAGVMAEIEAMLDG